LRDEWLDATGAKGTEAGDLVRLVRDCSTLGEQALDVSTKVQLEGLFFAAKRWQQNGTLSAKDARMVYFALKLTMRPGLLAPQDVQTLRDEGLSDTEIHDVVNVTACFAYMNRLADGLGAVLEPRKYALATELFGGEHLARYRALTEI